MAATAAEDGSRSEASTTLPAGAVVESEAISAELEMAETAMLGLRLVSGVDLGAFARRYGRDFDAVFGARLAEVSAAGLLERAGESLRLSERGRLLGNEVFACLLPDGPGGA